MDIQGCSKHAKDHLPKLWGSRGVCLRCSGTKKTAFPGPTRGTSRAVGDDHCKDSGICAESPKKPLEDFQLRYDLI